MARAKTQRRRATDRRQKDTLEQAAALVGTTVSGIRGARRVGDRRRGVVRHQLLVLSERDSAALAAALANPPVPNQALLRAVDDYRQATAEA